MYFRFPLSFRVVEDILAYKGIIVTHQTIRTWAEKFGRATRAIGYQIRAMVRISPLPGKLNWSNADGRRS